MSCSLNLREGLGGPHLTFRVSGDPHPVIVAIRDNEISCYKYDSVGGSS